MEGKVSRAFTQDCPWFKGSNLGFFLKNKNQILYLRAGLLRKGVSISLSRDLKMPPIYLEVFLLVVRVSSS